MFIPSLYRVVFNIHKTLKSNPRYSLINFLKAFAYIHKNTRITIHEWKIIWFSTLPALNSQRAIDVFCDNVKWDDKFNWVINYEWNTPHVVHISITEICPYNCKHCSAWRRKDWKIMSKENAIKLMNELSENKVSIVSFTWWEPLTYPYLEDLINNIDTKNINTFMFTTWYSLTEEKAKKLKQIGLFGICISFNSSIKWEMDDFMWFNWALENAINAIKISKKCWLYTIAQITATKEKISSWEIDRSLQFLKKLNIDEVRILQVLPAWKLIDKNNRKSFLSNEDRDYLKNLHIKANNDFQNYPKTVSMPYFESNEILWCHAWSQLVYIETEWNLYPCDFVETSYGNVFKDWFIETYNNIRKFHNKPLWTCLSLKDNECKNCTKSEEPMFFRVLRW